MSDLIQDLASKFNAEKDELAVDSCAIVSVDKLLETVDFLKKECAFDVLIDIVGVDYLGYPAASSHIENSPRFAVIYALKSTKTMTRLRLKVKVADGEKVPTLSKIYPIADWQEREVFDQFGIVFDGHNNLRRILNHVEFEGYPLRKDYPAQKRQWLSANDKMLDQLEERLETLGYKVIERSPEVPQYEEYELKPLPLPKH